MSLFKSLTKSLKNLSPLKIAILLLALLVICSMMNINIIPQTIEGFSNDSDIMKHFIHRYINLLEEDVVSLCESTSQNRPSNPILNDYITYLDTTNPEWRNNVCFETFEGQDQSEILHNITSREEWRTFLDVYFEDILTSRPRGCVYLNQLKFKLEERGLQNNNDIDALDDDTIRDMGGNETAGSWTSLMESYVFGNDTVEDSFGYWLNNDIYEEKCDGYDSFHREHGDLDEEIIRIEEWWGRSDHSAMDLNNDGTINVRDLLLELREEHEHVGGGGR